MLNPAVHSPGGRQKRRGVPLGVKDGRTDCRVLAGKTTQEKRVLKSTNPPPPLPPPAPPLRSASVRPGLQTAVRLFQTQRCTGGAALYCEECV
ncbi:Hypothetical predicted protein [Xyrichtys novacula]|uniref:Uncharacterized protein n=1 Tax=Xyrichtys novacula TaxID=13765 RepID=A0AAV1FZ39_XYRNO|nr:Hypothetical predicted protein [Xyrichtys novacula]